MLATKHLNAINQLGEAPWKLSFSYGRALQDSALKSWQGRDVPSAQKALYHRAKCNSLASAGKYNEDLEQP